MNTMEFLPELVLIGTSLTFFLLSLFNASPVLVGRVSRFAAVFLVLAASLALRAEGSLFFEAYKVDFFSQSFKFILALGFAGVLFMIKAFPGVKKELSAEYAMFLSISTLGLTMLVSAVELLTMLLCLEISSFAIYLAIPMRKGAHRFQYEAGIKYVLFGALSTGISLFGMSYLLGFTGTTYFAEFAPLLPELFSSQPLSLIAFLLLLSAFFYKLALFPMHFWSPDIYQGAANETAAFIATLPKLAAVGLLVRLLALCNADFGQLIWVLSVFAILSMSYGNLAALVQKDIKRLLAYSSIAHAGYLMLAILSIGSEGFSAAVYYVLAYLIMSLACFYVLCQLGREGENIDFEALKGLHRRSPLLAFTLLIAACGMAGIPLTVGFSSKFLVFTAAISKGYYGLVILAVINAAISAFYYLKLIRAAYALPEDKEISSLGLGFSEAFYGIGISIMILITGIFPEPIVYMIKEAVSILL